MLSAINWNACPQSIGIGVRDRWNAADCARVGKRMTGNRLVSAMSIQLWSSKGQHFFVDTELYGVQVGQAWEETSGHWKVEVNDDYVTAEDLKDAIRIFMHYTDAGSCKLALGQVAKVHPRADFVFGGLVSQLMMTLGSP